MTTGIEPKAPFFLRWRMRLIFVAVVTVVLFVASWWSGPVRFLQFSASDIHDSYDGAGGITGDFNRSIKARCSEEIFHRYARQQGLSQRLSEDAPGGIVGWSSCPEPWWTPPKSYRGAYYSYREGGKRSLLAYSDGHLYYDISVW
jgi:hypothetical protein